MAIEWKNDFSTHDLHIDEQHQQIFRFANKLEELAQRETVEPQEMDRLLHFLDTYVQSHFRYEEACMLKRRCPVAQQNRSEHLAFKAFIDSSLDLYRQNGYSQPWAQHLYKKLETWLTHHICHVDIKLRDTESHAPNQV